MFHIWRLEERDEHFPYTVGKLGSGYSIKAIPNAWQKQNKGKNYDLERKSQINRKNSIQWIKVCLHYKDFK